MLGLRDRKVTFLSEYQPYFPQHVTKFSERHGLKHGTDDEFVPLCEAIISKFLPSIFGGNLTQEENYMETLPVHMGDLCFHSK